MTISERIASDLKEAMKAKDELKLTVLRQIKAAAMNEEIRRGKSLPEEDVTGVIFSIAKSHKESIESFTKGSRPDLAEKEEKELAIIMNYLPQQLGADEIRQIVSDAVKETGASSQKDMGKVMGKIMPKVKGKADGSLVNSIVKEFLEPEK
jgi:uncharacterized protein